MLSAPPDPGLAYLQHLERQVTRQQWIHLVLALPLAVCIGMIGWTWYAGFPIYFIPPGGPGLARPGVILDSTALTFAAEVLMQRYTFVPDTFVSVQADFRGTLHPSMLMAFDAERDKEFAQVKRLQLSMQTWVVTNQITAREGEEITVSLEGRRKVWVGSAPTQEQTLTALVTLMPWRVRGNPMGLVVIRMRVSPAFAVAGA